MLSSLSPSGPRHLPRWHFRHHHSVLVSMATCLRNPSHEGRMMTSQTPIKGHLLQTSIITTSSSHPKLLPHHHLTVIAHLAVSKVSCSSFTGQGPHSCDSMGSCCHLRLMLIDKNNEIKNNINQNNRNIKYCFKTYRLNFFSEARKD